MQKNFCLGVDESLFYRNCDTSDKSSTGCRSASADAWSWCRKLMFDSEKCQVWDRETFLEFSEAETEHSRSETRFKLQISVAIIFWLDI